MWVYAIIKPNVSHETLWDDIATDAMQMQDCKLLDPACCFIVMC